MKNEPSKTIAIDEKSDKSFLYNAECLAEINAKSDEIIERNDYVNEFFIYFVIPFIEKTSQLNNKNEDALSIENKLGDYFKSVFLGIYLFWK